MSIPAPSEELSLGGRVTVLIAAFLGWMFAGLQIALFVLIHRPAMLSLFALPQGGETVIDAKVMEQGVTEWFAWFQAAFLFGAASGGWVFGVLGDRYGRTRALGWSILCYSGFTGLCYFAESPLQLLILRFLSCHGIGGAWPNTVALVAEAWPGASRPLLAGLLGTAANFGQVAMGLLGIGFDVTPAEWRWTFLAAASPFLIGMWCLLAVPESRRWLASRSRQQSGDSASTLGELFRPPYRNRTLMGILLGAVPVIGTAANAQWIVPWTDQVQSQQRAQNEAHDRTLQTSTDSTRPAAPSTSPAKKPDPKGKARTMVSRSGGAVFGSLLGGILAGVLGRRMTYFLISLLSLIASTWIFGWLDPGHPWFQWSVFGFGLVGTVYFGWLPLYLPELFPTRLRATGTGISFNTGRSFAALIALGTGVLLSIFGGSYARIGFWTGMIYALGMVIIFFAPRTDGGNLKD